MSFETFGIVEYSHVGLTRQYGRCIGVSLSIPDGIVYSELQELSLVEDNVECIFKIRGHAYFIGLVYGTPNNIVIELSNTMRSILDKVAPNPVR